MPEPDATLAAAAARGRRTLEAAGLPNEEAAREAALLARWLLGWDAATWLLHSSDAPPPNFDSRFQHAIERRALHEPIAYIIGTREFYGRDFVVTPAVLIPRPETELVIEAALDVLADRRAGPPPVIVDVGTGSGCLAVTIALERPDARLVATDISGPALAVARQNARRLGTAARTRFVHGAFLAGETGPFDLIVANPPYISEHDRGSLPIDVARFEPAEALFAGESGLDVIRALLPLAVSALSPTGRLVMEIGQGELADVQHLAGATVGLAFDHFRADLQAIPRVVVLRRTPAPGLD